MRRLLFFLLLFSNAAAAQDFGRNAVWYRYLNYGAFKCYYTGDTVILGKTCASIYQQTLVRPFMPTVDPWLRDMGYLYVYDNQDTVFVYNDLFGKFTPLYVFDVVPGDTITLPALPPVDGAVLSNVTDSTFDLVIDSVKDVLYDTVWLQTVFSHSIRYPPGSKACYEWREGTYARKIGGVLSGLLPDCRSCMQIPEAMGNPDAVLCYTDGSTSIRLTGEECNRGGVPLAVAEPLKDSGFEVFPNPVANTIGYVNNTGREIKNIKVLDISGKEMNTPGLSVSELANGLYFVRFQLEDFVVTRKVIVQR